MNILYVHQYFTTREGSLGTRSYEFSKYLLRQGHQVTMLTGDSSLQGVLPVKRGWLHKRYVIDGIQVIAVNNHYSNYMGFFRRIVAFIGFVLFACFYGLFMKRPDIVLATSTPLTVAIPALVMKKLRSIPFVFEVRDLWPEAPIQIGAIRSPLAIALLQALERKTYREASQLVALSPGMAQGIFATGIAEDKVTLIPNCSDLELFA
ncbi:MAG: glycosyltransferase family 4 protein, partial [Clostridia bacterium]